MGKRGRPKGANDPKNRKDDRLVIPMTTELKEAFGELAIQHGVGTATFARYLIEQVVGAGGIIPVVGSGSGAGAADVYKEPKQ